MGCLYFNNTDGSAYHTNRILNGAIKSGGTTIRSYTSSLGVNGLFQLKLKVHNQSHCQVCQSKVIKFVCDGRGTYRCAKCQKMKRPAKFSKV